VNWYVVADDVHQHIYWMAQFQDPHLFKNDLLTDYAKHYQTWGFILFYYLLSFLIDPLVISKVLPIVLLSLSALYIFKLVKHITNNNFTAFFAAFAFAVIPVFFGRMVGGFPRAFGFPLLVIFFYYLLKKEYKKTAVVLILQSLFYPVTFLICLMTWILSYLKLSKGKLIFERSISAYACLAIGVFMGSSILLSKHVLTYNPSLGTIVNRQQMTGQPEFYSEGRSPILPTSPLFKETFKQFHEGHLIPTYLPDIWILFTVLIFLAIERIRKKIYIPYELLSLFLSGLLLYEISDYFLMKLFLPKRYVEYSLPFITFILYVIAIHHALVKIKNLSIKKTVQIGLLFILLINLNLLKSFEVVDYSKNQKQIRLYNFLKSLPKDSMIAAHPSLARTFPMFSQRKVFVNYELSHPWMEPYWTTIKSRTFNFFNAHYSENLLEVYQFCLNNGIDYLVINKRHFSRKRLEGKRPMYFEPFNSFIATLVKNRKSFALENIPDEDKVFQHGKFFVINRDVLDPNVRSNKKYVNRKVVPRSKSERPNHVLTD
jgi:hypothetical protein